MTFTRLGIVGLLGALCGTLLAGSGAAQELSREEANKALQKAVKFYREQVSANGAYLWRYSEDLSLQEGETAATKSMGWVQPPGTPSVGEAYLAAYQRTGEKYLLDAAIEAARALVKGQLISGGWDYRLETDPQKRSAYAFRVDGNPGPRARNVTTLDDNTTQSAVRFLMHVDQELKFQDQEIHEAVEYALQCLLKAQYPNGAWPQRYSEFPQPEEFPVIKANYPESWPKKWPNESYSSYYTLNDNAQADVIDTMYEAGAIYNDPKYSAAATRGGDFLVLAQMPDPQPAWAQQYNTQMQPAWARRFEPPAITGGESQGAMRILMQVYRETGDKKYLEPIPRALAYLEKSLLPNGRLARFYELKTNRPLYFTRQYELVYTADDLPTHYAFIIGSSLNRIRSEYERLLETPREKLKPERFRPRTESAEGLAADARRIVDALDERGAWVEDGRMSGQEQGKQVRRVIDMRTLARNVTALARYIAAKGR